MESYSSDDVKDIRDALRELSYDDGKIKDLYTAPLAEGLNTAHDLVFYLPQFKDFDIYGFIKLCEKIKDLKQSQPGETLMNICAK